jgi:hypothetical protein
VYRFLPLAPLKAAGGAPTGSQRCVPATRPPTRGPLGEARVFPYTVACDPLAVGRCRCRRCRRCPFRSSTRRRCGSRRWPLRRHGGLAREDTCLRHCVPPACPHASAPSLVGFLPPFSRYCCFFPRESQVTPAFYLNTLVLINIQRKPSGNQSVLVGTTSRYMGPNFWQTQIRSRKDFLENTCGSHDTQRVPPRPRVILPPPSGPVRIRARTIRRGSKSLPRVCGPRRPPRPSVSQKKSTQLGPGLHPNRGDVHPEW